MVTCVIPAAGPAKNPLFPGLRDPMVPINGKPTADYSIGCLKKQGVTDILYILHADDKQTKNYLEFKHPDVRIETCRPKSLGETLAFAKGKTDDEGVLVLLGDTVYTAEFDFSNDFIVISKNEAVDSAEWCWVEKPNGKLIFHDKPKTFQGGDIVAGIYFFKSTKDFFSAIEKHTTGSIQMADIIVAYQETHPVNLIIDDGHWFDIGHIEHFYRSKIDFLRSRAFNAFEYDEFSGTITKKSTNNEKLLSEINWFQNIPQDLKIFTPRLLETITSTNNSTYKMEFYGYPTLADSYIFSQASLEQWKVVLTRLFVFLDILRTKYNKPSDVEGVKAIYVEKNWSRIKQLKTDLFFSQLVGKKILINGKEFDNPLTTVTKEWLEKFSKQFSDDKYWTVVHGDFCFNNILYDMNTGVFRLIDPRGSFGKTGVYGHLLYDYAKLRHSAVSLYDYITADLFVIDDSVGPDCVEFDYEILHADKGRNIAGFFDAQLKSKGIDPDVIKRIEGLLFLTMIPLHSDKPIRQQIMFIRAVELLDEK